MLLGGVAQKPIHPLIYIFCGVGFLVKIGPSTMPHPFSSYFSRARSCVDVMAGSPSGGSWYIGCYYVEPMKVYHLNGKGKGRGRGKVPFK